MTKHFILNTNKTNIKWVFSRKNLMNHLAFTAQFDRDSMLKSQLQSGLGAKKVEKHWLRRPSWGPLPPLPLLPLPLIFQGRKMFAKTRS